MPVIAVQDLSLCGILARLGKVEELKTKARPDDDDQEMMASEGDAKKALGERLELLKSADDRGLTSNEKAKTAAFIDVQIKGLDPHAKGADVRKTKLGEMKALVQAATSADEPAHVRKSKDAMAKGKKDFKAIQEKYERWEKGKLMFKTTEELTDMKKQHKELTEHLETLQAHLEDAILRKTASGSVPQAARVAGPSSVDTGRRFGSAPKAKPRADPGMRAGGGGGGGGGYPSASGGGRGGDARAAPVAAQVSAGALRAAQFAAEMRVEAEPPQPAAPSRQKAPKAPKEEVAPVLVLSYKCTVRAVCERLKIPEEKARDLASSSAGFQNELDRESWEWVQNRSQAIEKEDQEKQKAKEKKKMDKALNRVTGGDSVPAAPIPSAHVQPAAKPAAKPKAKAPPKAKAKTANIAKLATKNQWEGMSSSGSDGEDAWTTVQR